MQVPWHSPVPGCSADMKTESSDQKLIQKCLDGVLKQRLSCRERKRQSAFTPSAEAAVEISQSLLPQHFSVCW